MTVEARNGARVYRAKNREKINAYQRAWRKANRERVRKYQEEFYISQAQKAGNEQ